MSTQLGSPTDEVWRGRPASVSPVPREGRPYQGRRAGIVSRVVAGAVDFVVVGLILAAGYAAVCAAVFLWAPSSFRFPKTSTGVLLAAGAVVMVVYLTLTWATTGRTYGDHLLGLRVVNDRCERPGLGRASSRAVLCVVFPVGLFFAVVSQSNRSVQDLLLRTSVIYDWGPTTA